MNYTPCVACGKAVPEFDMPPFTRHAVHCPLAKRWRGGFAAWMDSRQRSALAIHNSVKLTKELFGRLSELVELADTPDQTADARAFIDEVRALLRGETHEDQRL